MESFFFRKICSDEQQRKHQSLSSLVFCGWKQAVASGFSSQRASNAESESMPWRHYDNFPLHICSQISRNLEAKRYVRVRKFFYFVFVGVVVGVVCWCWYCVGGDCGSGENLGFIPVLPQDRIRTICHDDYLRIDTHLTCIKHELKRCSGIKYSAIRCTSKQYRGSLARYENIGGCACAGNAGKVFPACGG